MDKETARAALEFFDRASLAPFNGADLSTLATIRNAIVADANAAEPVNETEDAEDV